MPRDCLRIIKSKSKVLNSRNKPVVAKVSSSTSTPGIYPDVAELKDMVKALLLDKKNQTQALAPVKAVEESCVTCGGSGTLPSNTTTNPKVDLKGITTRSGVAYQGPTIPTTTSSPPKVVERKTKPVVAPVSALMPNPKSSIPYPSRRNDERRREKANDQIEKFYEIFKDLSFKISLTDALILMPKFASTLKSLIRNKEKLSEMARTPLNEHCSVILLKDWTCFDPTPYYGPIVSTSSPTLTPFEDSDFLLEEVDASLTFKDDPTSPEVNDSYYDLEGDILLLEAFLNDDPSLPPPTQ
ncbi:hypothetical protein Tco_0845481, partial [Tanacetum coccineum]